MWESWRPQESSWVTPPSIDDELESPVEKFLAVLQLFTENLPYKFGRKGFTATQMVALLSTDNFHAFKTPILEHIAMQIFRLINQYSQTAVTFHKQLHNEEQASSNGNQ